MRHLAILLTALAYVSPGAHAEPQVGDIRFPEAIQVGDHQLELTGAGLYRKFLFQVYANALYLPQGTPSEAVLGDTARCLMFHYFREISADQFAEAAAPYLDKNLTDDEMARFREELDRMNALYRTVNEGDRYRLCYVPGKGVTLALNGETLGSVGDRAFANAYFRIWLGRESISNDLRDKLLPGES